MNRSMHCMVSDGGVLSPAVFKPRPEANLATGVHLARGRPCKPRLPVRDCPPMHGGFKRATVDERGCPSDLNLLHLAAAQNESPAPRRRRRRLQAQPITRDSIPRERDTRLMVKLRTCIRRRLRLIRRPQRTASKLL